MNAESDEKKAPYTIVLYRPSTTEMLAVSAMLRECPIEDIDQWEDAWTFTELRAAVIEASPENSPDLKSDDRDPLHYLIIVKGHTEVYDAKGFR